MPEAAQLPSIRGTVLDANGDFIAGARVLLLLNSRTMEAVTCTDGEFSFPALTSGAFHVTFKAAGFATKVIAGAVHDRESYTVPPVASWRRQTSMCR